MLNIDDKKIFDNLIKEYIDNDQVNLMKTFIQHGDVTTFDHCISVASKAYEIAKNKNVNVNTVVVAALLHDFYLYDWHDKPYSDLHGYRHPERACQNAIKYFDINKDIQEAIRTHMWPFTFKIPKTKEAFIVSIADKICAIKETLYIK